MLSRHNQHALQAGFTLVELVIVIVVLGIISVYAAARSVSPAEATLPSQAQKMASNIRHAQTLAYTWGKNLTVTTDSSSYSVYCTTSVASPCPASTTTPITDPATNSSFNVSLQKDVVLGGTATLVFNSLGQPGGSASYTLTSGSTTEAISVAALTGNVTVSP